MGHEPAELETRLARVERTLYGDDDASDGLSSRMHLMEVTVAKIDATLAKLNWLIIAGVIVGILNLIITKPGSHAPTQSTSVITGDAGATTATAAETTRRTYLTTADVAAKEGVSVREVTDMIAHGEIEPPPVKDGREFRIAANYRILPQDAADCGNQPQ